MRGGWRHPGLPSHVPCQGAELGCLQPVGEADCLRVATSQVMAEAKGSVRPGPTCAHLCPPVPRGGSCTLTLSVSPTLPLRVSGTLCCSACTGKKHLLQQQNIKKLQGTKNNCVQAQLDKLWTTRYKETQRPTSTSEQPGAKAGSSACPLHTTPPEPGYLPADPWTHPQPHPVSGAPSSF